VKFLPDEIEALIALGDIDRARYLTSQLEAEGRSMKRPWALATGMRCRAQIAAADGDLEGARVACEQALLHHERLPMPFELGRTLLVHGMIQRRAKHKLPARESLAKAQSIFEQLGAPIWAEKARREVARACRRASLGRLTDTEHRVAALVAQGLTNHEVASAMFVTENTVQTHIRHIFHKLGVRSRTELAARLLSGPGLTTYGEHAS
jgi:DNA-binding CsgD family transcriptional regulator